MVIVLTTVSCFSFSFMLVLLELEWEEGFWDTMEKLGFVSNAAVVSGLTAFYIQTGGVGNRWSSGPKTSLTSYWYFCRSIHFRSEFYFRFDVHTSTFPRSWPSYHGGGQSCTRTGSSGVGSVSWGAGTEPNTPRTDRCDLRYGWDQIPYSLPAISSNDCLLLQTGYNEY